MSHSLQPYGHQGARQAPLSMGFSRQEYWSGLPSPPPGDLPNPGVETASPMYLHCRQILDLLSHQGKTIYVCAYIHLCIHMYIGLCLLRALHRSANLIRINCKVYTNNIGITVF